VQFQKISIPTPRRVSGNSKEKGRLQKPKTGISMRNGGEEGGPNQKNPPWEVY